MENYFYKRLIQVCFQLSSLLFSYVRDYEAGPFCIGTIIYYIQSEPDVSVE